MKGTATHDNALALRTTIMPQTPCREPLCPSFSAIRGRCVEHAKAYDAETKRRTIGRALYGKTRWKRTRLVILRRDRYTCAHCLKFGNQVDHIEPLARGGLPYDPNNLQTLCGSCHSRKTAQEVWA